MRYAVALLTAALFAAILSAASLDATDARAAGSYNGYVKACNGKKVYLRFAEKRTLRLHNRARANRNLPRLCVNQKLQRAARKHSTDMIRNDYFSHTSRGGSTSTQRIKREGYTARGMSVYRTGENIGGGSGSFAKPLSRHRAWMNSRNHRKNILNRGFRQVGIGVVTGEYRSYKGYKMYTVDFGYRRR